jgi:hypothetical protein
VVFFLAPGSHKVSPTEIMAKRTGTVSLFKELTKKLVVVQKQPVEALTEQALCRRLITHLIGLDA